MRVGRFLLLGGLALAGASSPENEHIIRYRSLETLHKLSETLPDSLVPYADSIMAALYYGRSIYPYVYRYNEAVLRLGLGVSTPYLSADGWNVSFASEGGMQTAQQTSQKTDIKKQDEGKQPPQTDGGGKPPEVEEKPTEGEQKQQTPEPSPIDRVSAWYGAANSAFNRGDYENAMKYYENAFDIFFGILKQQYGNAPISDKDILDDSPWTFYFLGCKTLSEGMVAYNNKEYDKAEKLFKQAVEDFKRIEPETQNVDWSKIAKCEEMLIKTEEARKQAQPQEKILEDDANRIFVEATERSKSDLEGAKAMFEEAKRKYEEAKKIYDKQGDNKKSEEMGGAIKECEKQMAHIESAIKQRAERAEIERKVKDAEQKFKEGNDLLAQGKYESAIPVFDEAKKLYISLSDTNKVVECSKKINFCNGKILYANGEKLYGEGKYEEAKAKFMDAGVDFDIAGNGAEYKQCEEWVQKCDEQIKNAEFDRLLEDAEVGAVAKALQSLEGMWECFKDAAKELTYDEKKQVLKALGRSIIDVSEAPEVLFDPEAMKKSIIFEVKKVKK